MWLLIICHEWNVTTVISCLASGLLAYAKSRSTLCIVFSSLYCSVFCVFDVIYIVCTINVKGREIT